MNNNPNFSSITRSLHHRIDNNRVKPVVTPLYQNSAFSAESPYFYTRKNNPNYEELEQVVSMLEGSAHVISVSTGMAALSAVTNLLRPDDTLVINKYIYGCSHKFFQRFAAYRNIKLIILDLCKKQALDEIPGDVNMVVFETPTNPFLKTVSISQVSERVKQLNPNAWIVVDNTWATPLYQKPLNLGADLCIYSATKFFSGHSDVMGGLISTNNEELAQNLRDDRFYNGSILDPHSAWLLRRSMFTFHLRMDNHQMVAKEMFSFLSDIPQVAKVYYPEIDNQQLKGYGCILFFEIREDLVEKYQSFSKALNLFDTGTGMACVTSMVAQPYTGSHASMTDDEKQEMGLGKNLVRLCFGLETIEDLKQDLRAGFNCIDCDD
ncbi:MAG: PLP-dependent transferase [Desulfobacteraceae bacterium]|nr:PLP-dependent transferase [Desulfobacteraceae bacterium]